MANAILMNGKASESIDIANGIIEQFYSDTDAEIKRVWVEPNYRRRHIAVEMMKMIENKAKEQHFTRTLLQTREAMTEAVSLYEQLGYYRIENYPPYDKLDGAVCYAKDL